MAFQTHWNRFARLFTILPGKPSSGDYESIAKMAYQWGREDAAVEQRIEEERRLAGQLSGGLSNEGQSAG